MNRDYSVTGFFLQGRKLSHTQKPPFEGGYGGVNTAANHRKIPIIGLSQIPQMFAEKIRANPRDLRAK